MQKEPLTPSSCYTQKHLHREASTHWSFYTRKLSHVEASTQSSFDTTSFYTQKLVCRNDFYVRRRPYTQKLLAEWFLHTHLHADACRHRRFFIVDTEALSTKGFTHIFSTEKPLQSAVFTHRGLYTQKPLHTEAFVFTQKSFYT